MKRGRYIVPILLAILITGCIPDRFSWSPDGKWMTVLSYLGLRVCDQSGNLQPGTVPNVGVAVWFPDSSRIMAASQRAVKTWAELQPILSPQQIDDVTAEAARLKSAAMAFDWSKGDWQAFLQSFTFTVDDSLKAPVALYLAANADQEWNQKIPAERRKQLSDVTAEVYDVSVCTLGASGLATSGPIFSTLQNIYGIRISPTGKDAIVVTAKPDADQQNLPCQLIILSVDGSQSLPLTETSSWYPDWTTDGKSVVFATATAPFTKDASLGTLRREQVIGDDGQILLMPQNTEDLAGIVFSPLSRVRCLSDGRIIFASAQVTLPATPSDLPKRMELFSLSPGQQATVSRLFPWQTVEDMGDGAQFFAISPDEKYVSIPDSSGKVDVITLATGEITVVQDKAFPNFDNNPQLVTVPSWRRGDELTFASPGNDPAHMDVTVYSVPDQRQRNMSVTWPEALRSVS
ncbi:MAG TPA: hypothetical protein VMD30_02430, partial [Tepidisphaeraceae bacterium]|nr:hypothetical protein [Tepidisphaeraceae bacterium]